MIIKLKGLSILTILFLFVSMANAQTVKTAKGNFCGFEEGDGGYLTMRVGNAERTFAWYGDEPELKFVGFRNGSNTDLHSLAIGTELIVSYVYKRPKQGGSATNIMRKLTATGKVNRQTRSCGE